MPFWCCSIPLVPGTYSLPGEYAPVRDVIQVTIAHYVPDMVHVPKHKYPMRRHEFICICERLPDSTCTRL